MANNNDNSGNHHKDGIYTLWDESHKRTDRNPPDISPYLAMMKNANNNNNSNSHRNLPTTTTMEHHPDPDPLPRGVHTSHFSPATIHESEAERLILEAVEQERQQRLRQQQRQQQQQRQNDQPFRNDFPSSLPAVSVPGEEDGDEEGSSPDHFSQPRSLPPMSNREDGKRLDVRGNDPQDRLSSSSRFSMTRRNEPSSSLVMSTRYLMSLQEHDDRPDENPSRQGQREGQPQRQEPSGAARRTPQQQQSQPAPDKTQTLIQYLEGNSTGNTTTMTDGIATTNALDRMTEAAVVAMKASVATRSMFANEPHSTLSHEINQTINMFPYRHDSVDDDGRCTNNDEDHHNTPAGLDTAPDTEADAAVVDPNRPPPPPGGSSSDVPAQQQPPQYSPNTPTNQNNSKERGHDHDDDPSSRLPVSSVSFRAATNSASFRNTYGYGKAKHQKKTAAMAQKAVNSVVHELDSLMDFFKPQQVKLWKEVVNAMVTFVVPSLALAVVLFYLAGNPPTGRCRDDSDDTCGLDAKGQPRASISWWLLFLGVRQVVLWLLARGLDVCSIDWLLLQHPFLCRMLGPQFTLLLLQSKGWPSVLFWWCLLDAAVLYGEGAFPQHWLYWQDELKLFTDQNPSGDITTNAWYRNILIAGVILSVAVSLKRNYVGLHLGRRLYSRFHDRLETAMKNIAIISELAIWARHEGSHPHFGDHKSRHKRRSLFKRRGGGGKDERPPTSSNKHSPSKALAGAPTRRFDHTRPNGTIPTSASNNGGPANNNNINPPRSPPRDTSIVDYESHAETETTFLDTSESGPKYSVSGAGGSSDFQSGGGFQRVNSSSGNRYYGSIDYDKLLEPWNEPPRRGRLNVTGNQIVQFRQAFAILTKPFVLSSAFGPVESQNECIQSSFRLFYRLVRILDGDNSTSNIVDLERLVFLMFDGMETEHDKERADDLIELITPDSDGKIEKFAFVKAIDRVYREIRLLENGVLNASHLDREYERVINYLFYLALACLFYAMLGLDLQTLIFTMTSLVVAFSFMFGPGSAQLFEGVMFILGRQSYDVGDHICMDFTAGAPNLGGSPHWIVESIDLVSTKARLMHTSELATFSNGALARSRIMNFNRSPDPFLYTYVRFETDVPYSTILIFREAMQKFIEDRPQEWQNTMSFRTSRIEAQENFVEYMVVMQHRKPWSEFGDLMESKAAADTFTVELLKQMDCHYKAPSKPVHIRRKMEDIDQQQQQHHQQQQEQEEKNDDGSLSSHDDSAGTPGVEPEDFKSDTADPPLKKEEQQQQKPNQQQQQQNEEPFDMDQSPQTSLEIKKKLETDRNLGTGNRVEGTSALP